MARSSAILGPHSGEAVKHYPSAGDSKVDANNSVLNGCKSGTWNDLEDKLELEFASQSTWTQSQSLDPADAPENHG